MNPKIWTAQLPGEILPKLVNQWAEEAQKIQETIWMMIEWWNKEGTFALFSEALVELQAAPGESEKGSAFGALSELRWRRVGQEYWLVVISEDDLPGLRLPIDGESTSRWLDATDTIPAVSPSDQWLLLWGNDQMGDEEWVELRIPRRLRYPVKAKEAHDKKTPSNVQMKIVRYADGTGKTLLARRASLRATIQPKGGKS